MFLLKFLDKVINIKKLEVNSYFQFKRGGKEMKNSIYVSLFVTMCILGTGCSLTMKDQTPETFPWIKYENNPIESPDLFMYEETFLRLADLNDDPNHTFNLEVKPKNVSNVSCYVIVDGTEYEMQRDSQFNRLYTWTPDIPLGEPTEYYFKARFKPRTGEYKTNYLGSQEQPFHVEPVGYGYAVIIVPNQIAIPFDNTANLIPSAHFYTPSEAPLEIIVQSLHPDQVRVQQVELINFAGEPNNNNYFRFIDLPPEATEPAYIPTNGIVLNFGKTLRFKVTLTPEGETYVYEHGGAICNISMMVSDANGFRNEHIKVHANKEPL